MNLQDLRTANDQRNQLWDSGGVLSLAFRACELGGEAGEVLNVCKKLERERLGLRGSRDTKEHLAEELADVIICADLIAMTEGIDLSEAVVKKFDATSEKLNLPVKLAALRKSREWIPAETPPPAQNSDIEQDRHLYLLKDSLGIKRIGYYDGREWILGSLGLEAFNMLSAAIGREPISIVSYMEIPE